MALSLEYVAGYIDGEGCILVHKAAATESGRVTPRYDLHVSAYQCSRKVLNQLSTQFGGKVYTHNRSNRPTMRDSWSWRISGPSANAFLTLIYPYLVEKKEQSWLGLEFYAQKQRSTGHQVSDEQVALREGFYLALQAAKREEDAYLAS